MVGSAVSLQFRFLQQAGADMKRLAVFGTVATFAVASLAAVPRTAHAQLTMQMGNGWSLSFSGNVNAFEVETFSSGAPADVTYGNVASSEGTTNRLRTGLLPAFAVFDVKGKEGPLDLGVHFGFAPQIQNGAVATSPGNPGGGTTHDQFGAQIDMRQVYLTVGGSWGQILAGREIGLYQRENILTDMTLTGVGAAGSQIGNGGTTLGRIGFGYTYPNFNAQITYSSPATNDVVLSIGLFDPSALNGESAPANFTRIPRIEAEVTYTGKLGTPAAGAAGDKVLFWVGGTWQEANFLGNTNLPGDTTSVSDSTRNAEGVDFGVKLDVGQLSLVGSGYYDKGVGTTLMFTTTAGFDGAGQGRTSFGYIGQITYKIDPKWTIGASIGASNLLMTDNDRATANLALLKDNLDGTAMITYQWTKSLRFVGEYDYVESVNYAFQANKVNQIDAGFMLFF
jgi:hypothetical protein